MGCRCNPYFCLWEKIPLTLLLRPQHSLHVGIAFCIVGSGWCHITKGYWAAHKPGIQASCWGEESLLKEGGGALTSG